MVRRRTRGERASSASTTSASLWTGAMARALLVALSAHLLVAATNGTPPRLAACREVVKAKDATEVYPVSQSYSCDNISFPCGSTPALYADTRNCENFYRCTLMTLEQCPCPIGTTFNVQTQMCDNTSAACTCSPPLQPPTTTSRTTTLAASSPSVPSSTGSAVRPPAGGAGGPSVASPSTSAPTVIKDVVEAVADGNDGTTPASHAGGSSSNVDAAVVVPAIVCCCVFVVAVVGILAFLYVRGYLGYRKHHKPNQPPGVQCIQSGTVDRHVYAEIDESKVNGQILWSQQHVVGSVPPPPPPPPPPVPPSHPAGPHFYPLYPVPQQQQLGTLRGLQFSQFSGTGSVKRAFPLTNPHMRCYDRSQMLAPPLQPLPPAMIHHHHHHQQQPHWPDCGGTVAPSPGAAAAAATNGFDGMSECSQCSACSSNQASLDVSDSDMHTPLNASSSGGQRGKAQAYVSKQVYI